MTQPVLLLISLVAVTFIGANVLYIISDRKLKLALPETIAISYGLGLGSISLEMLVFYILKLQFSVEALLAPWLILVVVNSMICFGQGGRLRQDEPARFSASKLRPLDVLFVLGISLETLYALFRAVIKPIESYDAIAIYAIRSKIFFLAKSIPQDYFSAIARLFPHADYPLNIQLSETFLYMSMNGLNEQLVKVIFPMFFAAILCVFYFSVRRFASRTYALIFTFVLASIPHFNNYATNAYLEVPLAFYIFVSGVSLLRWIEDGSWGALLLSAVTAALAGWTKNEGLMYCIIFITLVFWSVISKRKGVSKKDIFSAAAYSGIILCILLPWALVKSRWNIVNDEIALSNLNPANLARQLHKLGPVFYELQKQVFGPKKWNIFWPVAIAAFLLNIRSAVAMPQRYITAAIIMALGGYVIFYMISYVDVVFFASKTCARFLLDLLPLAAYLLAVILKDDIKC